MAIIVEVLDKKLDNFSVAQKTTDEQLVYSKIIPAGILGLENYLRLTTQWSRFALGSATNPSALNLSQIDQWGSVTAGNTRSSWSYVGKENNKDVIYHAVMSIGGGYKLYKESSGSGPGGTFEEVPLVPTPISNDDFNSNQKVGIADQPCYSWFYLFGFTVFLLPLLGRQVAVKHGVSTPSGWGSRDMVPWSLQGDTVFGVTGQSSLSPDPLRGIHAYSITQTVPGDPDGAAQLVAFHETPYAGSNVSWVYAIHATANWLYSSVFNTVTGTGHILKMDKSTFAVAADYDTGFTGHNQGMYVVNEDLIYIANMTSNNGPLKIGAWVGGDGGSMTTIDDGVDNWTGHVIWVNNLFPSYVTMGYQVINGVPYLYIGTDGANGNNDDIRKIQLGDSLGDCP